MAAIGARVHIAVVSLARYPALANGSRPSRGGACPLRGCGRSACRCPDGGFPAPHPAAPVVRRAIPGPVHRAVGARHAAAPVSAVSRSGRLRTRPLSRRIRPRTPMRIWLSLTWGLRPGATRRASPIRIGAPSSGGAGAGPSTTSRTAEPLHATTPARTPARTPVRTPARRCGTRPGTAPFRITTPPFAP